MERRDEYEGKARSSTNAENRGSGEAREIEHNVRIDSGADVLMDDPVVKPTDLDRYVKRRIAPSLLHRFPPIGTLLRSGIREQHSGGDAAY